jgi:hypothetical protein
MPTREESVRALRAAQRLVEEHVQEGRERTSLLHKLGLAIAVVDGRKARRQERLRRERDSHATTQG